MSRRVPLLALAAVVALGAASAAQACRVYSPPEERIFRPTDAIIIARIETAAYVDSALVTPNGPPWLATARRTAGIKGLVAQDIFEIGRSGVCDDGQPIAKVGEFWALYLQRRPDGSFVASASYPLEWARTVDQRLNGLP